MTQTEYEKAKRECWEYVRKTILTIGGEKEKRAFDFAFDRAYALGKIDGAKEQKERDDHYIEMQKAFSSPIR